MYLILIILSRITSIVIACVIFYYCRNLHFVIAMFNIPSIVFPFITPLVVKIITYIGVFVAISKIFSIIDKYVAIQYISNSYNKNIITDSNSFEII
ncbi:hypothetical protein FACS189459_1650 [Bacilli bacterium]|nr:hypothetical protein FACS189459_1650 [Bacilli bacterium]